eukprot:CAMPEP_0175119658 /NCGR_PEP_ID=MMETSP0087-20121206/187_1 /TAXON_ID=136419 /ORGANISM="Unknown Unknown, Strain D1" /LENGTH=342 /DNA_ID=CAMNT_0016401017 /DNA_START=219 /DNA_END=1247 /DNA_ORIENTATION=+
MRSSPSADTDAQFLVNPDNPPDLGQDYYAELRGIDFKDREAILQRQAVAKKGEWDGKLEKLRQKAETDFAFSEEEQARIAAIDEEWQNSADTFQEELGVKPTVTTEFSGLPGQEEQESMNELLEANVSANPALMYEDLDFSSEFMPLPNRKTTCIFCTEDTSHRKVKTIEYTNVQLLIRYINERGMVKPRKTTFTCAKHQRKLATAIKRARFMGLLNYTNNFYVPQSFALDDTAHGNSKLEDSMGFRSFKESFEIEQDFSEDDVPEENFAPDAPIPDIVEIEEDAAGSTDAEFRQKEREKTRLSKERAKLKKKELKVSKEDRFNEILGSAADDLRDSKQFKD